jgi:uncharacterized protein
MSNDFRQPLVDYIRTQALPPDKFSHQARLYRLATQIAEHPFDDDILFAAAWLHDLGVFVGHRPEDPVQLANWDHLGYVLGKAPEILERVGFPGEKTAAVLDAIRTHLPTGIPVSYEGELLRDADILEQLGAVGVLRTVSKVGRDTRFLRFGDALKVLRRNLEDLPARLRLEKARALATERIQILRQFLKSAEAEANGMEW